MAVMRSPRTFVQQATKALRNQKLQRALAKAKSGFIDKRRLALEALPEFLALRQRAKAIKEHTFARWDFYLERFEQQVIDQGGQVHWAQTAQQACQIIVGLCQSSNATLVTKGKTMIGEEIGLNAALEQAGVTVIETDLGEYIIQLAKEPPSHIIAPAVHKTREEITTLFHVHHQNPQRLTEIPDLVNEARQVLREKFLHATVGITGANFLVAETGSVVLVTNEGNGDLTASLPKTHIVITSIDKIVPTLEDATTLLRLLSRSATGQELSAYTSLFQGSRRKDDLDGPTAFHVVLLDNGRSQLLGTPFQEMLRCIRCGACLNHCPVYSAIGGHAYGWVYPGPMGSVLTPLFQSLAAAHYLPHASTLCGRCAEVCPMQIPLPALLRQHRQQAHFQKLSSMSGRVGLSIWVWLATHPHLYHLVTRLIITILSRLGKQQGAFRYLPFFSNWTTSRDFPVPQGETFMAQWTSTHSQTIHNPLKDHHS